MHAPSHLLLDLPELGSHAVRSGFPFDLEFPRPGFSADKGEAQEVEGRRFDAIDVETFCENWPATGILMPKSASQINELQPNSLRNGTGNFRPVSGSIFQRTGNITSGVRCAHARNPGRPGWTKKPHQRYRLQRNRCCARQSSAPLRRAPRSSRQAGDLQYSAGLAHRPGLCLVR